jgi:hypothetical protein
LCIDAEPVGEGTYPFSTVLATGTTPREICDGDSENVRDDIWYRYTAGCSGTALISLCGSNFNTRLAVYGARCPTEDHTALACSDNSCGQQSELSLPVTAGLEYLVRVGGNAEGTGALSIACTPTIEPADCNCDDVVDFFDIDPFLLALFDAAGYAAQYPACDRLSADANDDGAVDFFDIDPFLALLFGP